MGVQQPMVSKKEQTLAVRRGWTATHGACNRSTPLAVRRGWTATHGFNEGKTLRRTSWVYSNPCFQVGALPCIVADSYQRFLSRNTISQNAGVWCRSESNNEREKGGEGGGGGGGGEFSPCSFPSTKRRKDKLFPAVPTDLGACVERRSCPHGRPD